MILLKIFSILDNFGNHLYCEVYTHNSNSELILNFQPFMLCLFKFDDFEYVGENDYITKQLILQNKLLYKSLELKEKESVKYKEQIIKLENDIFCIKEKIHVFNEKLFMIIEHKYF